MRVFKFGGASVKDEAGVRNVAAVLGRFEHDDLVIVVSAMGKTTNALEAVVWATPVRAMPATRWTRLRSTHAGSAGGRRSGG